MEARIFEDRAEQLDSMITSVGSEDFAELDPEAQQRIVAMLDTLHKAEVSNAEILLEMEKLKQNDVDLYIKQKAEDNKVAVTERQGRDNIIKAAVTGGLMLIGIAAVAIFEKSDNGGIISSKLLGPIFKIIGK